VFSEDDIDDGPHELRRKSSPRLGIIFVNRYLHAHRPELPDGGVAANKPIVIVAVACNAGKVEPSAPRGVASFQRGADQEVVLRGGCPGPC
jgi:hypothetical protein